MPEISKYLIICGDDFGILPEIDHGLIEGIEKGVLTCLSLVPNGPNFSAAVRYCRDHPKVEFGIHLSLVEGFGLDSTGGRTGMNPGRALPKDWKSFLRLWSIGRINTGDMERELRRQIERVLKNSLNPFFLNCHQHLHFFPPIGRIIARLGREYNIYGIRQPAKKNKSKAGKSLENGSDYISIGPYFEPDIGCRLCHAGNPARFGIQRQLSPASSGFHCRTQRK